MEQDVTRVVGHGLGFVCLLFGVGIMSMRMNERYCVLYG